MSATLQPSRSAQKKHRRHAAVVTAPSSETRSAVSDQELIFEGFSPSGLRWNNIDWVVLGWMTAMHIGAFAAPFFFTWQAFGVAMVMWWLTGSVGVCLGYHRFL